ncbi:sodium-coupled monocarboxylate transporter 1 [Thalassophryne amazonica]|uniref:sodium-coupled monocarboxylate transporter 1 n=1 Tax=Thalassophryne amazonica TaxID=390379 RepID=UPI0014720B09|nr:sodium-coupled monocarboxylate transporter 1 [Thalassophryne amazonica]
MAVGYFAVQDYVVFAVMLVVSAAIGVYFAWVDKGRVSSKEFLTGGRRMTALPVSLSLVATFLSAISMLSAPAEVYRYGAILVFACLSLIFVMVVTSEIYLPVFYRLDITSTYEYLELRFSKATRLLGTVLFVIQAVLYTGMVIYVPALALSQVTGMNVWGAVISTGMVCTFYCTLGGLKAVVWTDVFQAVIMLSGFLAVIIKSVVFKGGVSTIISDSQQGGRLNFWDFDMNPKRRHTFWTVTIGGVFLWTSIYAINQAQVQRYMSCKTITHAKLSLYINLFGLWVFLLTSIFAGLCLFSVYKNCDPWTAGLVSTPDQMMPYLAMDILRDYPGIPGLFIAAAYSGSLSTVSSSINALATVTVEDMIKPYTSLSEKYLSWLSKGLTFLYGILCIGMAGLSSTLGAIMQAVISILGVTGGPLLGLFTLGFLCPFANSKGALLGVVSGLVASVWLTVGVQIYPPPPELTRPLPLTTDGCNFTATHSVNRTSTMAPTVQPSTAAPLQDRHFMADNWPYISYLYTCPIGTITAIGVGVIVSLLSGGLKAKVDSRFALMKEDTSLYYIFVFFKKNVMRQRGMCDLTKETETKTGNTNPAFCDIVMDFKKEHSNTD